MHRWSEDPETLVAFTFPFLRSLIALFSICEKLNKIAGRIYYASGSIPEQDSPKKRASGGDNPNAIPKVRAKCFQSKYVLPCCFCTTLSKNPCILLLFSFLFFSPVFLLTKHALGILHRLTTVCALKSKPFLHTWFFPFNFFHILLLLIVSSLSLSPVESFRSQAMLGGFSSAEAQIGGLDVIFL